MRVILILVLAVVAIILGLNVYLSPDDLSGCNGESGPGTSTACQPADAVVAISGGDTEARTAYAIDLYKRGWAPTLIFSGAAQDKSGPSNAEAMYNQAVGQGVPAADIIIEEYGETTKENAANTQNILQGNDISSVILVTSAYHQRRANLEFNQQTQNVTVRNHPVPTDNQWSTWWWLTPTGWYLAASEVVKIGLFYSGVSR